MITQFMLKDFHQTSSYFSRCRACECLYSNFHVESLKNHIWSFLIQKHTQIPLIVSLWAILLWCPCHQDFRRRSRRIIRLTIVSGSRHLWTTPKKNSQRNYSQPIIEITVYIPQVPIIFQLMYCRKDHFAVIWAK